MPAALDTTAYPLPRSTPPSASRAVVVAPALRVFLRQARLAWWRSAASLVLLVATSAAALVPSVAWLVALGRGSTQPEVMPWLPIVFALAGLAGLVVAAARAPSLLDLAREADRRLAQAQRLSTALEVQVAARPQGAVVDALIVDAESRAGSLDGRVVGARPVPKAVWLLLALSVSLASLSLVVPVPQRPLASRAADPAGAGSQVTDRPMLDAAAVQRVAELLAAAPEAEASPYLQAVAASFAELGERLSLAQIDAAEAERMLNELFAHLQTAAQEVGGTFAETIEAAVGAMVEAGGASASAEEAADAAPRLGEAPEVVEAATPRGEAEGRAANDLVRDGVEVTPLDRLMASLEAQAREEEAAAQARILVEDRASQAITGGIYGGVAEAATDPNAAPPSGLRAEAAGAGDVAGAADRSTERAGDAAGGGHAALGEGSDDFLGIDGLGMTEVAALPWNEREDGRRVDTQLVPEENLAAGERPFQQGASGLVYTPSREAAATTTAIGATYRDVVSRYFTPGTPRGAEGP